MIGRLRQWMNQHSGVVAAIAVTCLLASGVWLYAYYYSADGTPTPTFKYHCVNGHEWNGALAGQMPCPVCGEPAIYNPEMICTNCEAIVRPVEHQKLGPGEHRYRIAGEQAWRKVPPQEVRCSNCGKMRAYAVPSPGRVPANKANRKKLPTEDELRD